MTESKNKTVFADNLKHYMQLHRIDRNMLCSALGLKYTTVSEWLAGNKYPRIDKIELLANYFGVQKSDLIEERSVGHFTSGGIHRLSQDISIPFLTPCEEFVSFPVLNEGEAAKGVPLLGQTEESVKIHSSYLNGKGRKNFFVLKITGDRMFPLYQKNDKVLIERITKLKYSGQICVSVFGNEPSSLGKIEYSADGERLLIAPLNPMYQAVKIEPNRSSELKILGIPKMLIREIKES